MVLRLITAFLLAIFSYGANADNLRILLGSDMARIQYASESIGQSLGRVELEGGLLYSEEHDDTSDYLVHFGAQVRGESLDAPLIVTVGTRLYYGSARDENIGGLGIGGELILAPDGWSGFGLGASLYFVPSVVAFAEAEGLLEYGVTANFQVSNQATVMLGYQKAEAEIKNQPDRTITDGAFIGVNLAF